MSSATYFLPPVSSDPHSPTFANAFGFSDLFSFSHTPSDLLVATDAVTLANQGVALVTAEATASGFSDGGLFADLLTTTDTSGIIIDGASEVKAEGYAEVVASFTVAEGETFTFDFDVFSDMASKEIENPDREYSEAFIATGFIVLETSDPSQPELLGYFGSLGTLVSSEMIGDLEVDHHVAGDQGHIEFIQDTDIDIDQDNQVDYVSGASAGFYEQSFEADSQITIIQFNSNLVEIKADVLIDRLGRDVTYGTIWDDTLSGGGKVYASLGNDKVYGRRSDDILEGGHGNDTLKGFGGDDSIHGGMGEDLVIGGRGDDVLIGGADDDRLLGHRGHDRLEGGDGEDTLSGGSGRDTLDGGDGNDRLSGRSGNDSLKGGEGDDELDGGRGRDHLDGGGGADTLTGGSGNDTLQGGGGDDLLIAGHSFKWLNFFDLLGRNPGDLLVGGEGNDTLQGGFGGDTIIGGLGDDEMRGSWGADEFVFVKGESLALSEADVISDFTPGRDVIVFEGWGLHDEEDWLSGMTASGDAFDTADGVRFLFEEGASLSLLGPDLSLSDLRGSDFEFI